MATVIKDMRCKTIIIAVGLAGLLAAGQASAEMRDEAMIKVTVSILPNIAIFAGRDVDLRSMRQGRVEGEMPFTVKSNLTGIGFSVQASHLYKGSDPNSINFLPLAHDEQIYIYSKKSGSVPFVGRFNKEVEVYKGFHGYGADDIRLESGDRQGLNREIEIGLAWINDDPDMPMGDYGGYVKVIGVVIPGDDNPQ